MEPIEIPADWQDHGLLTFQEFCTLVRIPQRAVRDWSRRSVGPLRIPAGRLRPAVPHRPRRHDTSPVRDGCHSQPATREPSNGAFA